MTAPLQYGTPQASDPTAVMGRRTLAWIADLLLYVAVLGTAFASMGEFVPDVGDVEDACQAVEDRAALEGESIGTCLDFRELGFQVADSDERVYVLSDVDTGVQTALSFGWFAFFVILQGITGGSPGKLLFGLRVVDQYGAKIGIGKSLGRTLMWVVDAAPWIIPIVGPIAAFTSNGHRRVGDLAAGTYVVASSSVGEPVMPGSAPIPAGQQAWGAAPPTAPPPVGQGWQNAPSAPPPTGWQTDSAESGRWTSPAADATPDLDFPTADVPTSGERADVTPPTVEADPDWSRSPDLEVTPPPAVQEIEERAAAEDPGADAPEWSAPTLSDIVDPADEWEPPTGPGVEPPPFAAPGADGPPTAPSETPAPEPPPSAPRYELPPPQWDPARNTYLQWEPNRQAWLQWDTAAERWKPIDT